jgi:hypothetical protein
LPLVLVHCKVMLVNYKGRNNLLHSLHVVSTHVKLGFPQLCATTINREMNFHNSVSNILSTSANKYVFPICTYIFIPVLTFIIFTQFKNLDDVYLSTKFYRNPIYLMLWNFLLRIRVMKLIYFDHPYIGIRYLHLLYDQICVNYKLDYCDHLACNYCFV